MKYKNDFHWLPILSSVLNAHPSPDTLSPQQLIFSQGQSIIFLASKNSFF